jgi:hypothetical protein
VNNAGPISIGIFHKQVACVFGKSTRRVPVPCPSAMYTSSAAGAQVRKVAPPGTRVAPSGMVDVMFSWEAVMTVPSYQMFQECHWWNGTWLAHSQMGTVSPAVIGHRMERGQATTIVWIFP